MGRRHGHALMPWGKFKGVRLRLIPVEYLSWLTTTFVMRATEWKWLKDSLISELQFRGLDVELAETPEPAPQPVLAPPKYIRKVTARTPQMIFTLKRVDLGPTETIGEIYFDEDPITIVSLELPNIDGKPGSCIPQGKYPVVLAPSPKFLRSNEPWVLRYAMLMPHIIQIPDRTDIMFHWGNDVENTEGCVLVGTTHPSQDFIGSSRPAFEKLWSIIEAPARSSNCWVNVIGGAVA